jgi:hypothetical protein
MMFNADSAATMRELVKAGTFGFAVLECDDMLATHERPAFKIRTDQA